MSGYITALAIADTLTGDELVEVSQLSSTVTMTAATISALASDNSYNDSGSGFVAAGFAVGDRVKVTGFTGNVANNIFVGQITALTTGKMTIGGTDGDVIVDDAAGESVTITKWTTKRTTIAALPQALFAADITPAQITASQDNYNPTGLAGSGVVRLSSDAAWSITGLAGGADGRMCVLQNVGAFTITLEDEHASSTAANRFALNADVALTADSAIAIMYDGTASRWRVIGGTGGGGGGATDFTDLGDVPASYSGEGGKAVFVNSGETALEFLELSTGGFETLDVDYTDGGNTTTSETDLFTYTVPASELGSDGDRIEAQWSGTAVGHATATRQFKAYFGGTAFFDSGALAISANASWVVGATLTRVSATVVRYALEMTLQNAPLAAYTVSGELTGLTLSSTNVFKLTGTAAGVGAATNDIVGKMACLDKKPVAAGIAGDPNPVTRLGVMPALAGFTQGNVSGTRVVTETAGHAFLISDSSTTGGIQIHGVYKTAPASTPYRVAFALRSIGQVVNYLFPEVGWRETSSGKLFCVAMAPNTNAWEVHSWNSLTSRSATISAGGTPPPANFVSYGLGWIGLRNDGTNIYFEYSPDGNKDTFRTIYTRTISGAFITSFDEVFVGMYQETATGRDYRVLVRGYQEDGLTRTY